MAPSFGKVDLVVTLGASDQIQLLTGDGKGAFTPQTAINVGAKKPTSMALGDLTGDGKLDAVVGHLAGNGFTVFINAAGVLGSPSNQVFNAFANITSVALADAQSTYQVAPNAYIWRRKERS